MQPEHPEDAGKFSAPGLLPSKSPSPSTSAAPDPVHAASSPSAPSARLPSTRPLPKAPPLVILAGGLSRRMGQDKAFVTLAGRPMIAHLIERLRPQASLIALNAPDEIAANGLFAPHEAAGLRVVPDPLPGRPGPLAGVLAALRFAREATPEATHVATVPVDGPFLPANLLARLAAAVEGREAIAVAASAGAWHPIVALWPLALADDLRAFILTDAKRRVRDFIQQHPHVVVDFPVPDGEDPFDNLNTPEDLARAEVRLAGEDIGTKRLPPSELPPDHATLASLQDLAPDAGTPSPGTRIGRDSEQVVTPAKKQMPDEAHWDRQDLTRIEEPLPRRENAGTRRVAVVHPAGSGSAPERPLQGETHAPLSPSDELAATPVETANHAATPERPAAHTEEAAHLRRPQRVLGVTGWKNSGKTGLVERLVTLFTRRGLTVSTIKHAHHSFDIDRPGADSYRHREAGAREVAIVAHERIAIMQELRGAPEPDLVALLARMTPVDLVIVEGYKREPIPKIEARRREARAHEPLAPNDPTIFAIAADHPVEDAGVPVIDLDDTEAIADLAAERLGLGAKASD